MKEDAYLSIYFMTSLLELSQGGEEQNHKRAWTAGSNVEGHV